MAIYLEKSKRVKKVHHPAVGLCNFQPSYHSASTAEDQFLWSALLSCKSPMGYPLSKPSKENKLKSNLSQPICAFSFIEWTEFGLSGGSSVLVFLWSIGDVTSQVGISFLIRLNIRIFFISLTWIIFFIFSPSLLSKHRKYLLKEKVFKLSIYAEIQYARKILFPQILWNHNGHHM